MRITSSKYLWATVAAVSLLSPCAEAAPQKAANAASKARPAKAPGPKKQSVAGVSVTGLDAPARTRRLKRELGRRLESRVVLTGGVRKVARRRRDVGVELEMGWMLGRAARGDAFVPLKLRVDRKRAQVALRRLAPRFAQGQRDARIVSARRGMRIYPERVGQSLNVGGAVGRLAQAVERDASARVIDLPVRKRTPRRTRASFKGVTGRLSVFSTEYNSKIFGRTRNMQLAARAIDDTLLKPGATFSMNGAVGPRVKERGYRQAIIFRDGKKEKDIGGGVSQITGTLFNAALLAGLPIETYRTHSRPVAYIPIGRDATVSWGNFDMKFRNDTGAPVYIVYTVANGTATASLFGKRVRGQKVGLAVVQKRQGARQISAKLFRTIRRNGKVVKKETIGDSAYSWKEDNPD
jgi:vancomycin resistance protein YoaR